MKMKLILFSGLPGTGKSTLARRLARELQISYLCIDDVTGEVPEDAGVPFWDSKVAILLGLARVQLELGISVILDSVFMNKDRYHAREIARKNGARFLPVYVFLSNEEVWKERVTSRRRELDHESVASWDRIQHQRQHFREWEPGTALFIDMLHPIEQNYAEVLQFVTNEETTLKPMEEDRWEPGSYHAYAHH